MSSKTRKIPPWTQEPCHECGDEYQVTRIESRTVTDDTPLLCDSCEMYQQGYDDGVDNKEVVINPLTIPLTGFTCSCDLCGWSVKIVDVGIQRDNPFKVQVKLGCPACHNEIVLAAVEVKQPTVTVGNTRV